MEFPIVLQTNVQITNILSMLPIFEKENIKSQSSAGICCISWLYWLYVLSVNL